MQDLPFPLASILRRHQRDQRDPEKAFHILVHFFEAFAEFWATVLLSALDRAEDIPNRATKDTRTFMAEKNVLPLETSSLGTWIALGGKLASYLRGLFADRTRETDDPPASRIDYFATRDRTTVDRLIDKRIAAALQRVGPLRSQGLAHGGVIGRGVAEQLHQQAWAVVAELRRIVGHAFRSLRLVRVGAGRLGQAISTFQCDVLMGSDPQFEIESIELEEHAYDGELYLVGNDRRALKILPLVRMAAPQGGNNACYFYNKLNGDTARYVSYHQESEAIEDNPTPIELLNRWNLDPEPDSLGE